MPDGAIPHYEKDKQEALRRVQHEMEIIDKLNYSAYFLISWDIVRYCMLCGFYHVGRESFANNIVAYCLKIKNFDTINLILYFERFLNPKRTSPPDFDIEYSWRDREVFTQKGRLKTNLDGPKLELNCD